MFNLIAIATVLNPAAIQVLPLKTVYGVNPIAMAPAPTGSKFVASLENATIRIMNAADRMVIRALNGHPQPAYAVAWSPNGKLIASGDESGRVFFWDAATGKKLKEVRTHTKGVQSLDFNGAGTILASTGKDDAIRFYDTKTYKEVKVVFGKGANLYGAKYVPGSNNLVVGTLDGGGVWTLANYAKVKVTGFGTDDKGVWDVDVLGKRGIAAQRNGTAVIWNIDSGQKIQTLKGHGDWVVSARFTPNGKHVVTSSSDSTVRIWDAYRFTCQATLDQQYMVGSPICITSDGKFLITARADNAMQVYSLVPPQK